MRVVVLCLCVCLSVFVSQVFAVPVVFDFSSSPDAYQTVSDLSLTIEAASIGRESAEVDWSNRYGLGVAAATDTSGTLDGSASDDVLTFDFGEDVFLQEIVFSWVNYYDLFELWVADRREAAGLIDDSGAKIVTYDFSSLGLISDSFSLMAADSNASFRIHSLTVETLGAPVPTPEPSTWLLLGSGLAGLLCWRKRMAS